MFVINYCISDLNSPPHLIWSTGPDTHHFPWPVSVALCRPRDRSDPAGGQAALRGRSALRAYSFLPLLHGHLRSGVWRHLPSLCPEQQYLSDPAALSWPQWHQGRPGVHPACPRPHGHESPWHPLGAHPLALRCLHGGGVLPKALWTQTLRVPDLLPQRRAEQASAHWGSPVPWRLFAVALMTWEPWASSTEWGHDALRVPVIELSFPLPWTVIPVASSAWTLCAPSFPTGAVPDSRYNPPVTGLCSPDGQGSGPAPAGAAGCVSLPSGGLGLQLL